MTDPNVRELVKRYRLHWVNCDECDMVDETSSDWRWAEDTQYVLASDYDSQQRTIEGLRRDAERLDYIEQLSSADKILPLVVDWTYEGKRYPTGIREAIDAALSQSSQAGE